MFILPNPAHKEFGMPNRNKDCVLITDIFYKINPEVFLLKREPGISTNDDFHIADSDYFAAHMRMWMISNGYYFVIVYFYYVFFIFLELDNKLDRKAWGNIIFLYFSLIFLNRKSYTDESFEISDLFAFVSEVLMSVLIFFTLRWQAEENSFVTSLA